MTEETFFEQLRKLLGKSEQTPLVELFAEIERRSQLCVELQAIAYACPDVTTVEAAAGAVRKHYGPMRSRFD